MQRSEEAITKGEMGYLLPPPPPHSTSSPPVPPSLPPRHRRCCCSLPAQRWCWYCSPSLPDAAAAGQHQQGGSRSGGSGLQPKGPSAQGPNPSSPLSGVILCPSFPHCRSAFSRTRRTWINTRTGCQWATCMRWGTAAPTWSDRCQRWPRCGRSAAGRRGEQVLIESLSMLLRRLPRPMPTAVLPNFPLALAAGGGAAGQVPCEGA